MAKRVQRYGVTATVMETLVGYARELIVNMTRQSVHLHDGATPGGFELGRADCSNMTVVSSENNGIMTPELYDALLAAGAAGEEFAAFFPNVTAETTVYHQELERLANTLDGAQAENAPPALGKVVLYTEEYVHTIDGISYPRIPNGTCDFAAGTVCVFYQAAPPIFWSTEEVAVTNLFGEGYAGILMVSMNPLDWGTATYGWEPDNALFVDVLNLSPIEPTFTESSGAHTHSVTGAGNVEGAGGNVDVDVGNGYSNTVQFTGTAASNGAHTHEITSLNTDFSSINRAYCLIAEKVEFIGEF